MSILTERETAWKAASARLKADRTPENLEAYHAGGRSERVYGQ